MAPPNGSHHPLGPLTWTRDKGLFDKSRVLASTSTTPGTAILFVHGWGGNAGDTWESFPAALRSSTSAAHADAFFLQYPSREHSVANLGGEFARLLLDVLRAPADTLVNPSFPAGGPLRGPFTYGRVLVVGHSMGAVVARRALLDLDRDWLTDHERPRMQLLFFAPAHKGSALPLLIRSGAGLDWLPGSALVGAALTVHYRSLSDLAEGSPCLLQLEEDSKAARKARQVRTPLAALPPGPTTEESVQFLRARVYHAAGDKVVVQDRFDDDWRPSETILGRNHRSICKPTGSYPTPIKALESLLSDVVKPI